MCHPAVPYGKNRIDIVYKTQSHVQKCTFSFHFTVVAYVKYIRFQHTRRFFALLLLSLHSFQRIPQNRRTHNYKRTQFHWVKMHLLRTRFRVAVWTIYLWIDLDRMGRSNNGGKHKHLEWIYWTNRCTCYRFYIAKIARGGNGLEHWCRKPHNKLFMTFRLTAHFHTHSKRLKWIFFTIMEYWNNRQLLLDLSKTRTKLL